MFNYFYLVQITAQIAYASSTNNAQIKIDSEMNGAMVIVGIYNFIILRTITFRFISFNNSNKFNCI
jgi:hypothetical protein